MVAAAVRALADAYGLAYEEGRGELGADASETAAREARYAWLEATRAGWAPALILTAHHADDQVETVLMRVLEGRGRPAWPAWRRDRGTLVRPLLPFRRAALAPATSAPRACAVWDDPANQDPRHLRSWLRTDVLPLLRARLPQVDSAAAPVGRHAARDRAAWNAVLELLPGLDFRLERDGFSVAARALSGYDSALGETVFMTRRAAGRMPARTGARGAGARGWSSAGHERRQRAAGRGLGRPSSRSAGSLVARTGRAERRPAPLAAAGAERRGRVGRGGASAGRVEPAPERQERVGTHRLVRAGAAGRSAAGAPGERHPAARRPRPPAAGPVLSGRAGAAKPPGEVAGAGRPDGVVWVPGVCRSDALLPEPGTEAMRDRC